MTGDAIRDRAERAVEDFETQWQTLPAAARRWLVNRIVNVQVERGAESAQTALGLRESE